MLLARRLRRRAGKTRRLAGEKSFP